MVSRTHVPLKPIKGTGNDVDLADTMGVSYPNGQLVTGYSGGILPVYTTHGERSAACHCHIGTYMMMRYQLQRYDALPGTSRDDTKHTLVMAHMEAIKNAPPKEWPGWLKKHEKQAGAWGIKRNFTPLTPEQEKISRARIMAQLRALERTDREEGITWE